MQAERIQLTKDYSISRVLNGCWQLSPDHSLHSSLDLDDVMKAFNQLVQAGFTTFDCADIYEGSEAFLGKFLRQVQDQAGVSAQDIQIHTKYVPDINILADLTFDYTESIIDRSLKRLGTEALDVLQFHWWDYETPGMIDTAAHLVKLQEKGKIRYVSVTNYDTPHLKQLVDAGIPILTNQAQYSVFDRRPEKQLIPYCQEAAIGLICYGTLSGGLLSERYLGLDHFQPETRSHVKYHQVIEDTMGWAVFQELLVLLKDLATAKGVEISHIANRYILQKDGVAATVIGVRNSKHAQSNQKIFSFSLEAEEMDAIDQMINRYPTLAGEPFELERSPGKFRNIMKMNITEEGLGETKFN